MLDRELASPASVLPGAPTSFSSGRPEQGPVPSVLLQFLAAYRIVSKILTMPHFSHPLPPPPQSLHQVSKPGPPPQRPESLDLMGLSPSSTEHFLPSVFPLLLQPRWFRLKAEPVLLFLCPFRMPQLLFQSSSTSLTNPFYQISFVTTPVLLRDPPPWWVPEKQRGWASQDSVPGATLGLHWPETSGEWRTVKWRGDTGSGGSPSLTTSGPLASH